jgi:hypothetical protein
MVEALRLADALADPDASLYAYQLAQAATELRRLHAENASLAAALASSCDEQRHELWESGGIAGCDRARVAERQRDALLEALKYIAKEFRQHGRQHWPEAIAARLAIKTVEETK